MTRKYPDESKPRSIIPKGSAYEENSVTVTLSWMKGDTSHC